MQPHHYAYLGVSLGVLYLLYLLFRDTMNRIQYVEHLRIYWITKDNGSSSMPFAVKAFMRQTAYPYWWGTGIQFRLFKYTFQVGVLRGKNKDLLEALDAEEMDMTPQQIREWGRPDPEVKS